MLLLRLQGNVLRSIDFGLRLLLCDLFRTACHLPVSLIGLHFCFGHFRAIWIAVFKSGVNVVQTSITWFGPDRKRTTLTTSYQIA